jgi:uncharacterized protein YbaA (DUF1428 family)
MPKYVDGFVIVIPKKKLAEYTKISKKAGKIWMEYGALEYRECVGEDMKVSFGLPFPKLTKTKPSEVVIFSWILYKSRKHRDQVNAKVMVDERMQDICTPETAPFDVKRMSYGGFETIVDL